MAASEADILLARRLISASSRHDLPAVKQLLKNGASASVQDPTTGTTPLHAAIASCGPKQKATATGPDEDKPSVNSEDERGEAAALEVVNELLHNGAIWNDLDHDDETPGCIALRLGLKKLYEAMVEAGVRAELLFSKMGALGIDDEDNEPAITAVAVSSKKAPGKISNDGADTSDEAGVAAGSQDKDADEDVDVSLDNHAYLKSKLRFKPGILLDESDNAVMMDWETEVMTRHAETLLPCPGLRALNVGHGMGIVDRAIQDRTPSQHHIIEAHPQVLAKMRAEGWMEKPGVRVWEGRWQDMLPQMVAEGIQLDAMYYDTFAEPYSALREFFSEYAVELLDSAGGETGEGGRLGWYNGLGADRQICYDVYTRVAEMDLFEAGFDTQWEDIKVPESLKGGKEWEGTRRPYWELAYYKLPINTFSK